MASEKANWDDIPSLESISVEWEYEPKNPEGKRAHKRMKSTDLCPVLNVNTIPVKVVAKNFEEKGFLVDITPIGMAVRLKTMLVKEKKIAVGLFLGKQKVVSKATVKNVRLIAGSYRIGMEFEGIDRESTDFIAGLLASNISYL